MVGKNAASATSTAVPARSTRAGRRATNWPTRDHAEVGAGARAGPIRGPNQTINAGVKVRLTATVTATQIAIGGPVVEKMASLVNPRHAAATMTVPAEATNAGPTRVADS